MGVKSRHTPRRKDRTEPDGRPRKITLGDLRATGVRDLLVFCQDYRCSHNVKLAADYVDRWPDEIRISQLEPRFVCTACGMRGSNIVAGSNGTEQAILPRFGHREALDYPPMHGCMGP